MKGSAASDYQNRVHNIVREDICGDKDSGFFRLVMVHCPHRTKHNKWTVAIEHKFYKCWVRKSDRVFDNEAAASEHFNMLLANRG